MKVMFDIDDTLFNNDIVESVLIKNNIDPKSVTVHWDIFTMDIPDHVKREIASGFENTELMSSFKPNDGAREAVEYFKARGDELIAITSRSYFHSSTTNKMMKRYFPEITKVYYSGPEPKLRSIKQLGVNVVIDDNTKTIDECLTLINPPIMFLVSNSMTPHNEHLIHKYEKMPNVHVITNLREVTNF
jgi:hypothetical protein